MDQRFSIGSKTLLLLEGNIVAQDTDAIGNAANSGLLGGGGVDGAIHHAAGPQLVEACREIKKTLPDGLLATGGAVITPGFKLKAKHVIHCVGPVYDRAGPQAPRLLASCYQNALRICSEQALRSIALPSISTGVYGYPLREAAPIALAEVRRFLETHDLPTEVRFVLFNRVALEAYLEAANQVLL